MTNELAKRVFGSAKVGLNSHKPLKHKNGNTLSDIEYMELLGRKAIAMDKEQERINPNLPTDYGDLDRTTIAVAKEIVRGIDSGMSEKELNAYLTTCIEL